MLISPVRLYRFARVLAGLRIPVLPKLIDYGNRFFFACWLPHTAELGDGLVLGYGGLGIVVHSNAVIGRNVHVDQGVTIGGNGVDFGVPRIGDDVYIGAGAKVLGPVQVGCGSIIGANAVVVRDVPPRCVVVGVPARVIREDIDIHQTLHHRRVSRRPT